MATSLFVAHALAGLPVFLAAMLLWWAKALEERVDDIVVDPRFLVPDSVPEEAQPRVLHRWM